jgi:hypothetical protein
MANVIASAFRVAQPSRSWVGIQHLLIAIGACLLFAIVSYAVISTLSLDPLEIAGETLWVQP